jgi:NitT/TauT family transport system substrate-binding protein
MGMLKMIDGDPERFDFSIHGAADEIVAGLQSGAMDIAAVPSNLASVLYNRMEGGIRAIAVNTRGVLYVLDTTGTVTSIEDLRGRTVYSMGLGTTPEFALNYILRQNGLEPGVDVTVEYKAEATELGTLIASGLAELCVLPEPYATTVLSKNESARVALSLSDEWDAVQPEFGMLSGTVVVRTAYLEENPGAVEAFLTDYRASVDFINANLAEGARLVEQYEIAPADVAEAAIPRCNIICMTGAEMERNLTGYLGVLFEADPKSVGGSLPDAAFYYHSE